MTRLRLELHPLAEFEIIEAHEWYQQCGGDAGNRFEQSFRTGIEKIMDAPERWPLCFGPTRRILLKRFPYAVIYHATSEVIRILAVAHTSREPDYWQDRV